jgi:hypothetical protein
MKTIGQFLLYRFSLAAFDAGRSLQVALGVKRERKKCNDGCEDDP